VLETLLQILNEGGVHSPADLARRLGVGQGLLEQMLADLERLGYLKSLPADCPSHCAGCSLEGRCTVAEGGRIAKSWYNAGDHPGKAMGRDE
jgi:hypothetical protein